MSAEKIQELDKRLSIQEVSSNRVLEALKEQIDSTKELTNSVTEMTANLSHNNDEVKLLRTEVSALRTLVNDNITEIKVIKSGNKWVDWAGRAIVTGIVGAVVAAFFYVVKIMP